MRYLVFALGLFALAIAPGALDYGVGVAFIATVMAMIIFFTGIYLIVKEN